MCVSYCMCLWMNVCVCLCVLYSHTLKSCKQFSAIKLSKLSLSCDWLLSIVCEFYGFNRLCVCVTYLINPLHKLLLYKVLNMCVCACLSMCECFDGVIWIYTLNPCTVYIIQIFQLTHSTKFNQQFNLNAFWFIFQILIIRIIKTTAGVQKRFKWND